MIGGTAPANAAANSGTGTTTGITADAESVGATRASITVGRVAGAPFVARPNINGFTDDAELAARRKAFITLIPNGQAGEEAPSTTLISQQSRNN